MLPDLAHPMWWSSAFHPALAFHPTTPHNCTSSRNLNSSTRSPNQLYVGSQIHLDHSLDYLGIFIMNVNISMGPRGLAKLHVTSPTPFDITAQPPSCPSYHLHQSLKSIQPKLHDVRENCEPMCLRSISRTLTASAGFGAVRLASQVLDRSSRVSVLEEDA